MTFYLNLRGPFRCLAIILRQNPPVLGLMIKPMADRLFSEREGVYRHAFSIGPIYFRTYTRKHMP